MLRIRSLGEHGLLTIRRIFSKIAVQQSWNGSCPFGLAGGLGRTSLLEGVRDDYLYYPYPLRRARFGARGTCIVRRNRD